MKRLLLITLSIVFALTAYSESTTIKEIIDSPEKFDGEVVIVSGNVSKLVLSEGNSTSYYMLEDDYEENTIRVNTAIIPPEKNTKIKINGIVYYDPSTKSLFISEQGRMKVKGPSDAKDTGSSSGVTLIIILVVLGAFSYFGYKLIYKKKVATSGSGSEPLANDDDDFKTIKLSANDNPKTLKFIPGELKVTAGSDAGKVFKIAGFPTPEGNVVTIGREAVKGERQFAHIRLLEKTISRMQAEIIQNGKELKLKNLSKTNFTTVDGVELKPDQLIEIKPNSTIKIGEVEFKYILSQE
jgi:hypothetical protein